MSEHLEHAEPDLLRAMVRIGSTLANGYRPPEWDTRTGTVEVMDEAAFLADASRPNSGEQVAKRLGFAHARNRVAQGVVDQTVDAFERGPISWEPVGAAQAWG